MKPGLKKEIKAFLKELNENFTDDELDIDEFGGKAYSLLLRAIKE